MGLGYGTTPPLLLPFILYFLLTLQAKAVYYPVREYSGSTFFDGWDFYGNVDNTTWGEQTVTIHAYTLICARLNL
jgi:hypothetical protein